MRTPTFALVLAAAIGAAAAASALAGVIDYPEPDAFIEPSVARHAPGDSIPYVIVTTRELRPEFLRLARAHTRAGLRAGVWTLESIRAGYPVARDDAERIRDFLQDVHRQRGARWLLIGGNANQIPVRLATLETPYFGPPHQVSRLPTDQYYACLDGSWNADGDDEWGESNGDDVDLIPELIVGRAPVGSPWEARRFVGHTIEAMELAARTPGRPDHQGADVESMGALDPDDASPLHRRDRRTQSSVLLAAEELGGHLIDLAAQAEQIRPLFEALPSTHVARLYENAAAWPGSAPESRIALIDSLDRGYDLAVLFGAGDPTRFSGGQDFPPTDLFTVDDAAALRNRRPTTVYFVSAFTCSLGATPCLGEAMINAREGNIVAVVGPTNIQFTSTNSAFARRFFDAGYQLGVATIGEAFTNAVVSTFAEMGDFGRLSAHGMILLGDPALPNRPAPPPPGAMSATATSDAGGAGEDMSLQLLGADAVARQAGAEAAGTRSATVNAADCVSLVPRGGARFDLAIPASLAGAPYEVAVFDAGGRRVRTIERAAATAGTHTIEWDLQDDAGGRVQSGVYFVGVRARGAMVTRRITVVR
jgi:hypothetical protein